MVTLSLPRSLAIWKYFTQRTEMMQKSPFLEAIKGKVFFNKLGRESWEMQSLESTVWWDTAPETGFGLWRCGMGWRREHCPQAVLWECRASPFLSKNHIYSHSQSAWTVGKWQYGSPMEFSYNIFLWFALQAPHERAIHVWIITSSTSWGKTLPKEQALVKLFPLKTSCTSPLISLWQELGQCLLLLQPMWGVWNISCHAVKQNNCTSI